MKIDRSRWPVELPITHIRSLVKKKLRSTAKLKNWLRT